MYRALAIVCAVAASVFLAWAGYSALRPSAHESDEAIANDERSLVVEEPERDLGKRMVGEHLLTIRVTNLSDGPAEVVGYPGSCGGSCCFFVRESRRRTVPPGESIEIVGELDIRRPGPFEFEGNLFLNDNGLLRSVRLKLRGIGVPAEKPNAPPP